MSEDISSPFYSKLSKIFYFIYILFFLFNFLGLSQLNILYGAFLALFAIMIFYLKPAEVLPYFFPFAMIEGQGRVLWAYNPVARLVFDVFLLIVAFKAFYANKKVIDTKSVPYYIYILITLHFAWYGVQLFNPNAISLYAVVTALKIYIVPFILFFSFLTNDGLSNEKNLDKLYHLIRLTLFLASTLAIFQFFQGDQFIIAIHPYYKNILKDAFTGLLYRPFSSTHLPGGYAVYMALFLPLLFIKTKVKKIDLLINLTIMLTCLYAMFLSQVRSSLLKGLMVIAIINIFLYLRGDRKLKKLMYLFGVSIVGIGIAFYGNIGNLFAGEMFETAIKRFVSITNLGEISSSREGPQKAISFILHHLSQSPLGLGPGRTGGVSNLHVGTILKDPIYNLGNSWAWDNLYISLVIDFGIGMIFYLTTIIIIPIKLINFAIRRFFSNSPELPLILVSAATTFVIILGNWGGILLPYNPESFCFWYYSALGFKYASNRSD